MSEDLKKVYLVTDTYENVTKTVKLSKEQVKVIKWLNKVMEMPLQCEEIKLENIEEI